MTIEVYTVKEVSKKLNTTVRTIREYIKNGKINAIKVGNKYIISEENYRNFVNGK
ncbi:helix-turn-helix domain-containing protein [Mammaliicoccus lentus]|uniref:helix-turn-helix domain-containing protein n=1 Tax=Mammaliicoccus lentus TaxID=42858 RepID=UPI003CF634F1